MTDSASLFSKTTTTTWSGAGTEPGATATVELAELPVVGVEAVGVEALSDVPEHPHTAIRTAAATAGCTRRRRRRTCPPSTAIPTPSLVRPAQVPDVRRPDDPPHGAPGHLETVSPAVDVVGDGVVRAVDPHLQVVHAGREVQLGQREPYGLPAVHRTDGDRVGRGGQVKAEDPVLVGRAHAHRDLGHG